MTSTALVDLLLKTALSTQYCTVLDLFAKNLAVQISCWEDYTAVLGENTQELSGAIMGGKRTLDQMWEHAPSHDLTHASLFLTLSSSSPSSLFFVLVIVFHGKAGHIIHI